MANNRFEVTCNSPRVGKGFTPRNDRSKVLLFLYLKMGREIWEKVKTLVTKKQEADERPDTKEKNE
jgi:hypothetical protein